MTSFMKGGWYMKKGLQVLQVIHRPVFGRCAAFDQLKHTDKRGKARESGSKRNAGHRSGRIDQKPFRVLDSLLIQIFIKRHIRKLFEQTAEVIL